MDRHSTLARTGRALSRQDTVTSESGFTIAEVSVALVVLAIALAMITPTFLALSDNATRTQAQAISDSAIRPALIEMANEVGSASVLYTPCNSYGSTTTGLQAPTPAVGSCGTSSTTQTGFAEMVYNAANGGTCTQWQVLPASTNSIDPSNSDEALLQVRSWASTTPVSTQVPFTNLVSGVVLVNSSSEPVFTIPSTAIGGDLLKIDVYVASGSKSPLVEIETKVAAQGVAHSETCNPPAT